jgi:hypothetical protein
LQQPLHNDYLIVLPLRRVHTPITLFTINTAIATKIAKSIFATSILPPHQIG